MILEKIVETEIARKTKNFIITRDTNFNVSIVEEEKGIMLRVQDDVAY